VVIEPIGIICWAHSSALIRMFDTTDADAVVRLARFAEDTSGRSPRQVVEEGCHRRSSELFLLPLLILLIQPFFRQAERALLFRAEHAPMHRDVTSGCLRSFQHHDVTPRYLRSFHGFGELLECLVVQWVEYNSGLGLGDMLVGR